MLRNRVRTPHAEDAVYLVIGAVLIVGLLTLAGLAVDMSNLYLAQLRLQRALDAATLGAGVLVEEETILDPDELETTTRETEIRKYAVALARDNIRSSLGPDSAALFTEESVSLVSGDRTVSLSAQVQIPLLLIDKVPGFTDEYGTVAAVSQADVGSDEPLAVVLVLDTTGSMGECDVWAEAEDDDGPDCLRTRLEGLQDATFAFLRMLELDPEYHYIGIVTYRTEANTNVPIGNQHYNDPDGPCSIGDAKNLYCVVNSFDDEGATNIYSGLAAARLELETLPEEVTKRYVVLFTDGEPNTLWEHEPDPFVGCVDAPPMPDGQGEGRHPNPLAPWIAPIKEADFIRDTGTILYTIKLGSTELCIGDSYYPDDMNPHCNFPLMRRIANDPDWESDLGMYCDSTYEEYNDPEGVSNGEAVTAADGTEMIQMFKEIATRILGAQLRLTK